MKKIICFALLLCGISAVYSQDLIKEFKKLTLENDSLLKELKYARKNSLKDLQASNDSIVQLMTANKTEISSLNDNIRKLQKDTAELIKQIKKFDKNNIQYLEALVQQKTDSIHLLTGTIKIKDGLIANLKIEEEKKQHEKYNEGVQKVYNQIGQIYLIDNFDHLIEYSNPKTVERDLQLVSNGNAEVTKKLKELQIYFSAKQVLFERYNEQNVKKAQGQLSTISQSSLLKTLNVNLGNYKLCNTGLQTTIGKIVELDKKFDANNEDTQKTKLRDILFELTWYFRNYRFNFSDYPYLSGIVLEIMKLKQQDANAKISDLLEKL